MNTFATHFQNEPNTLKKWVKGLRAYNNQLEQVYIAMIELLQTSALGKPVNRTFVNSVLKRLPQDIVCEMSIVKSDWREEKTITIELKGKFNGRYDYSSWLCTTASFQPFSSKHKGNTTWDFKFNHDSIETIISAINTNRKRVFSCEDAAKKCASQMRAYQKAMNTYIRAMEKLNPMFVDTHVINSMFGYNTEHYNWQAYENKLFEGLELYTTYLRV